MTDFDVQQVREAAARAYVEPGHIIAGIHRIRARAERGEQ